MEKLPLATPVSVVFEQFECGNCKKKFYINTEDKKGEQIKCPFCESNSKNIRQMDIEIKAIGELLRYN